jgi:hypothetical protein
MRWNFCCWWGVPIKEFKNMELQQNVGKYGRVILEIQSVTLLAT